MADEVLDQEEEDPFGARLLSFEVSIENDMEYLSFLFTVYYS